MFFFLTFLVALVAMAFIRFDTPDAIRADSSDFNLPKTTNSDPVPVIFGTVKIENMNVLNWGNYRAKAIKKKVKTGLFSSKRVTIGYKYYFTIDLAICWGPVDIVQIESGVHVVTDAPWASSGYYAISKPTIYGEEGGGKAGIDLDCTFYDGGTAASGFSDRVAAIYPEADPTDPADFLGGTYPYIFDAASTEADSHLGDSRRPSCEGLARLALDGYVGNTTNIRAIKITARHIPGGPAPAYDNINGDANPASVIYFVLTNKERGLGLTSNDVNISKLEEAAEVLYNENLGISLRWTVDISAEDLIQTICEHIDATYYIDLVTGQFTLELVRAQDNYNNVVEFTSNEIKEITSIERTDTNDIVNELKVKYIDRASNWKENVVIASNTAAFYYTGRVISETLSLSGLSNEQSALLVANRKLQQLSAAPASLAIKATTSQGLTNGQLAKINYPERGITNLVGRITEVDHGTLERPEVQIKLLEDVFTTRLAQFDDIPVGNWTPEQGATPGPLGSLYRYIELTPAITDEPALLFLAPAPSKAGDFKFYQFEIEIAESVIYEQSNLSNAIAKGDTLLNLDNALALDTATAAEVRLGKNLAILTDHINFEWIAYLGSSAPGQMESLERGLLDTTPKDWPAGTRVYLFTDMDVLEIEPDGTLTIDVVAFNGDIDGDPVSTTQTSQSKYTAPAPPEISVNGLYYPSDISGASDLTFSILKRDHAAIYLNGENSTDPGYTYYMEFYIDGALIENNATGDPITRTLEQVFADNSASTFTTLTMKAWAEFNGQSSEIGECIIDGWDDNGDMLREADLIQLGQLINPDPHPRTTAWILDNVTIGTTTVIYGQYAFEGLVSTIGTAERLIDVTSHSANIDAINFEIDFTYSFESADLGANTGQVTLTYYDNTDTAISSESGAVITPNGASIETEETFIPPVNTRSIGLSVTMNNSDPSQDALVFDMLSMTYRTPAISNPYHSQQITIAAASLSGALTNFPVVVTERDLDAEIWNSGLTGEIFVTDSNGTELTSELAWFDSVNQRLRLHFTAPLLSDSADNVFYVCWGQTTTASGAVFTAYDYVIPFTVDAFVDVQNFGTESLSLVEVNTPSYSYANGLTVAAADHLYQPITWNSIAYMVYKGSLAQISQMCALCIDNGSSRPSIVMTIDDGTQIATWDTSNSWLDTSPITAPVVNTPFVHHLFFEAGNRRSVFADGGNKGNDTTVTAVSGLTTMRVGASRGDDPNERWVGDIQEVRFSSLEFSDEWVEFEALNMHNVNDYTVGVYNAPV